MKKYISIIFTILIISSAVVGIVSIVSSYQKISKEKYEKKAETPKELEENKKLLEEKRKKREIELKNKYQSPKYRKELERLNKKIEINPNNAELYFERGNILKILCESKKAYSDYTKAIELSKKSKYYIARAGILRFNNERQVYSDIEKAIEISKDAETYEGVWDVYWFCGDWDNATKCVQEAIKLNPQKVELYIKRVETERVNPIVISLCDEYLKKFPNEYRFYILKMNAMVDLEENIDKTEIEKMLTKGNRMTKGEIYNEIGRIEFHNKNYPKAIENYDKAIEYDLKNKPKDYKYNIEAYYINKISVYSESKNIDKEIETLKKIIEINLGNEEDNMKKSSLKSYTKLAQYYEMELDEKKADENYKKANEIEEYQSFLE